MKCSKSIRRTIILTSNIWYQVDVNEVIDKVCSLYDKVLEFIYVGSFNLLYYAIFG